LLAYQRFISHDRRTVYVLERYENSDVAVSHLIKFAATFGERYGRLIERKRFLVFGDPSDELRALSDSTKPFITARSGRSFIAGKPPKGLCAPEQGSVAYRGRR